MSPALEGRASLSTSHFPAWAAGNGHNEKNCRRRVSISEQIELLGILCHRPHHRRASWAPGGLLRAKASQVAATTAAVSRPSRESSGQPCWFRVPGGLCDSRDASLIFWLSLYPDSAKGCPSSLGVMCTAKPCYLAWCCRPMASQAQGCSKDTQPRACVLQLTLSHQPRLQHQQLIFSWWPEAKLSVWAELVILSRVCLFTPR